MHGTRARSLFLVSVVHVAPIRHVTQALHCNCLQVFYCTPWRELRAPRSRVCAAAMAVPSALVRRRPANFIRTTAIILFSATPLIGMDVGLLFPHSSRTSHEPAPPGRPRYARLAFVATSPVGTCSWISSSRATLVDVYPPVRATRPPCRQLLPFIEASQQPLPPPSNECPPAAAPATLSDLLAAPIGHPGVVPAAGSPLAVLLDARTRLGGGTRLVCVYASGEGGSADESSSIGHAKSTSDAVPSQSLSSTGNVAFSAAEFHAATNLGGVPSLLVAADADGPGVWGGYNPVGWDSRDDYRDSLTAFLFREPLAGSAEAAAGAAAIEEASAIAAAEAEDGRTGLKTPTLAAVWDGGDGSILVAEKVGGSGAAVFDFADWAVRWGSDALAMPMNDAKGLPLDRAVSVLGTQYGTLPGGGRTVFGGERSSVSVRRLRVFVSEQWAPKQVRELEKSKRSGLFGRLFGR